MSKLTDKTVSNILRRYSQTEVSSDDRHDGFHKVMDHVPEIHDTAQRRIILWGDHTHIHRILDQPKMTHSTLWLAKSEIRWDGNTREEAAKLKTAFSKKLNKNFPGHDLYHPDGHVHTNVNYKPKTPK